MKYRKFKGDRLFTGSEMKGNDAVLVTDEVGKIEAIVPAQEAGDDIEILNGTITPGFVNCHCHLELSHLKDVIPPHTGLIDFLVSVVQKREFASEIISEAIVRAEKEMYDNGIVAVGDIGNTADTVATKSKSKIKWHNFVEVLSFTDEKADAIIEHYSKVLEQFDNELTEKAPASNPLLSHSVLTPHAPYSISPKTFRILDELTFRQIISIHNQEHPAEDELYKTGGGDYLKLFKVFGVEQSPFPVTGKSSVQSYLPHFNNDQTILFVHNSYMPEADVDFVMNYSSENNLNPVFCLCVNANLYIENKVPPIDLFMKKNCKIVLGTDSYSSNWQLSIAKEIAAIQKHIPAIPLETVLQWATINGAKALQWDDNLGSFEKGKIPGVVLLTGNFESRRLL